MKGVTTYEDRLRNPNLSILDFEFIVLHPEARSAIWEKYCMDTLFKMRIDEQMKNDLLFAYRFNEVFKSYLNQGRRR